MPATLKEAFTKLRKSRFKSESEAAREAFVQYLLHQGVDLQPVSNSTPSSASDEILPQLEGSVKELDRVGKKAARLLRAEVLKNVPGAKKLKSPSKKRSRATDPR